MAPDLDAADALAEQAEAVDAADRLAVDDAQAREAGEARCARPKRSRSWTFETSPPEARRARGYGPSTTPGPLPSTSGSPKSVASRPIGARIRAVSASSNVEPGSLRAEVRRQPVARVRVRPRLLDGEEPAHRRQFRDDCRERVVAVAEAR